MDRIDGILELKDLLFGARDNDDRLMIKQQDISIGFIRSMVWKQGYSRQENMHTIIRSYEVTNVDEVTNGSMM